MSDSVSNTSSKRPTGLYAGGIFIVVAAIGIVLFLSSSKRTLIAEEQHTRLAEASAGAHVQSAFVTMSPAENQLTLQGEARPYASVTLYAKLSGYLKDMHVDKGDRVREGQTLATIESPETDRAYLAALADAKNKQKQAERDQELLKRQLVSPQQSEASEAAAEIANQQLESIRTQKGYEAIVAPFSGVVTARYADRGALVQNAANSQTSALPIVTVSQIDRLRIVLYLDQRFAGYVHDGDPVTITLPERPDFKLETKVTRFTGELDPKTRMLLVEVEAPNAKGEIVAGSTVNASLRIAHPAQMLVPSASIVVRKDKYFVPVIDASDRISFKPVQVGVNTGETIEILSGLEGNERVGVNIGGEIEEGAHVQPVAIPASSVTPH